MKRTGGELDDVDLRPTKYHCLTTDISTSSDDTSSKEEDVNNIKSTKVKALATPLFCAWVTDPALVQTPTMAQPARIRPANDDKLERRFSSPILPFLADLPIEILSTIFEWADEYDRSSAPHAHAVKLAAQAEEDVRLLAKLASHKAFRLYAYRSRNLKQRLAFCDLIHPSGFWSNNLKQLTIHFIDSRSRTTIRDLIFANAQTLAIIDVNLFLPEFFAPQIHVLPSDWASNLFPRLHTLGIRPGEQDTTDDLHFKSRHYLLPSTVTHLKLYRCARMDYICRKYLQLNPAITRLEISLCVSEINVVDATILPTRLRDIVVNLDWFDVHELSRLIPPTKPTKHQVVRTLLYKTGKRIGRVRRQWVEDVLDPTPVPKMGPTEFYTVDPEHLANLCAFAESLSCRNIAWVYEPEDEYYY